MKITLKLIGGLALAIAAAGQTSPVPAVVATAQLPSYVALGVAKNSFAGVNAWASGVIPISNSLGLYESTTTDIFPMRATINGKRGYLLTTSVREGVHKVVYQDSANMLLFGGDGGFSFAQASAAGAASAGISAAVTFTYVRQLGRNWALMLPLRAIYVPTFGGWNPIAEFGVVWKPGATK